MARRLGAPVETSVTPEDVVRYHTDGVVCLRDVIDEFWIETLKVGVERILAEPGPHVEIYTSEDDPGHFLNDFDMWRHVCELERFIFEGPCAAIAARLMDARRINFFYDHLFVKEPGSLGFTPWHQDQPYMAVAGWQFCANWIPLDPISTDRALEFVTGSHLWGRWFAPFDAMSDGARHPSKVFERCPDIESARGDYDIVHWEMQPGDALFFHGLMLHQGRNNPSQDIRRRTITHRWLGDDTTFILRNPPAEFPKWPTTLSTGESFGDDPQFPLIFEA